ncbi:disulfide bond formation protein B, partial [Xanthomonas citri pv. citri]|nr:disulfide bond formation protein B [Xanthomonas citri pv. citri]
CEIGTNSCAKIEVEYLGFITLPLMSSVCFALIFGIGLKLIIKSKKLKQNQHVYN